ncbi:MAG: DUF2273 domain-containing protein [Aristaeellaceae bacterium]
MKSLNDFLRGLMETGTPACGLLCGILGVVLAALLLSIGIWRTLFVVALGALGLFLGGVKDKPGAVKALVNRLFPPKE